MFKRGRNSQILVVSKLDILLNAVVSLYLYMARTAKLKGDELNFIDSILHSMFGNDIPLYKLEQAKLQVLSVREAASNLNRLLSTADRSKIILNLITLAYHERSKINVLGSLEIAELTDLLRLDVSSLDSIYEMMEGKTDEIDLPALVYTDNSSMLRNSMIWAASGGDHKFLGADNAARYVFIMIEDMVLLYPDLQPSAVNCRVIRKQEEYILQNRRLHRLKEDEELILAGNCGEIRLRVKSLWQVYNLGNKAQDFSCPESGVKLSYKGHRFFLDSKNKYMHGKELALDEMPTPKCPASVLGMIFADKNETKLIQQSRDYYLCEDRDGLYLSKSAEANVLLHFYSEAEGLRVEKISGSSIFVNRLPLTTAISFQQNQDIISIREANYLVNRHWELIEIPIQIGELAVQDISHQFAGGNTALNNVSFKLPCGSMMAIMGPSGSGKTTLLQVLLGDIKASHSKILVDNLDFEQNYPFFQKYIGYVPQDDLLFANLTVYENLYYRIKLALPNLKNNTEIKTRIENLLHSVGLYEQRNMIVGDVMNKKLSGGQRRRLNIALELVLNPVIIILDEPTSGLSSKDSENIAEFLCDLKEQNKIVLCTIHQPNATVFNAFDKVLLLDKGGHQVYFGESKDVFGYFDNELADSGTRKHQLCTKRDLLMPDYFYDLIESVDYNGARLFPPEYWEQKYRKHSFRKALEGSSLSENNKHSSKTQARKNRPPVLRNLRLLTGRTLLNKSRSKTNLAMTLLAAPILALITAFVLRGVPEEQSYSFSNNANTLLFGFISVIIFIFIGLANSIDDILGEKRSILREMKLKVSALCQLLSKHFVLLLMTCLQALFFYFISAAVLGMRGFMLPQVIFLLLSGVIGYSLGLLFSAFIKDRSAIVNILPLVIIPQIMFSGAVIRFADMNKLLKLNPHREIPEFCQLIPSRWLYEGWVTASARMNFMERENRKFVAKAKDTSRSYQQYMADVNAHNEFIIKHPESRYTNLQIRDSVKYAHGDYLLQNRNIFLSHKMSLKTREYYTMYVDIVVALAMILALGLISYLRLKLGFR